MLIILQFKTVQELESLINSINSKTFSFLETRSLPFQCTQYNMVIRIMPIIFSKGDKVQVKETNMFTKFKAQ